ncbi:hypothetical protein ACFSS9_16065, partial [Paenibacillus septentrionalis]|uniref:hypothetical protein n=1 Tax=Paenibacillus septentrionalis TaxID=429342 RepID=UPI0036352E8F
LYTVKNNDPDTRILGYKGELRICGKSKGKYPPHAIIWDKPFNIILVTSSSLNLIIPYEMIFRDKENKATAIRSFLIGWLCVNKGAYGDGQHKRISSRSCAAAATGSGAGGKRN